MRVARGPHVSRSRPPSPWPPPPAEAGPGRPSPDATASLASEPHDGTTRSGEAGVVVVPEGAHGLLVALVVVGVDHPDRVVLEDPLLLGSQVETLIEGGLLTNGYNYYDNESPLLANRGALGFTTDGAQELFGGAYVVAPQSPSMWLADGPAYVSLVSEVIEESARPIRWTATGSTSWVAATAAT